MNTWIRQFVDTTFRIVIQNKDPGRSIILPSCDRDSFQEGDKNPLTSRSSLRSNSSSARTTRQQDGTKERSNDRGRGEKVSIGGISGALGPRCRSRHTRLTNETLSYVCSNYCRHSACTLLARALNELWNITLVTSNRFLAPRKTASAIRLTVDPLGCFCYDTM